MSKVLEFGKTQEEPADTTLTNIEKAQLAAQVAAIIRASFKQVADSDVRDVLQLASSQLLPLSPLPEQRG
jgi:hypothetical protein